MPVVDPEGQLPMFPQDSAAVPDMIKAVAEALLVQAETARVQSETARSIIDASRELFKAQRENSAHMRGPIDISEAMHATPTPSAGATNSPSADHGRGYGPSNPKHRTWRGFCLDMQRQVRELPSNCKPTKINVETHGSDTVRAINYAMMGYGLRLRDWPPGPWDPDEDRSWRSPKH